MSAATASVADLPRRTNFTNKDDHPVPKNPGYLQAQCKPIPLPALGTQRIIQGNGTNVGTVISLQCPAKHKLVGKELTCVMDTNSTHWVGETYCKPLSPHDDYGFRVAVLASIISSAIILLMSMAFLTCCLVDCIKKDKKRKQERELQAWQLEEQAQEHSRSFYAHKGRNNNNNNNAQEKMLRLWDTSNPALCGTMQPCRCHHQYAYSTPACTYGPPSPLAALPGHGYDHLLFPNLDLRPPQYPEPPLSSGSELVWQHNRWSEVNPTTTDGSSMGNINPNRIVNPKELSLRIISV